MFTAKYACYYPIAMMYSLCVVYNICVRVHGTYWKRWGQSARAAPASWTFGPHGSRTHPPL